MFRTLAALALTASLAGCHERIIAVTVSPPAASPTGMTVTGSATLDVAPDCADIRMTLSVDDARPAVATSGAQAKQQTLVDALARLGLTTRDLKLSTQVLDPIYEYVGNRTVLKGYRAAITITATTRQFERIGAIVEAGANAGATALTTQFRRSDLSDRKQEVRAMALAAAKAKAEQTAQALGIELGHVISVGESAGGVMWTNEYFPSVANARASDGNAGTTLGGALQPLSLDVTVVYALRDPRATIGA